MHSSDSARSAPPRTPDADVVVVGAGLAGLAAAGHLSAAGLHVLVLEAAEQVGGTMATDQADGFLLDRTGRLLCPEWPELRQLPALAGLELRRFAPGALLRTDGRTHRVGDLRRGNVRRSIRTASASRDSGGDTVYGWGPGGGGSTGADAGRTAGAGAYAAQPAPAGTVPRDRAAAGAERTDRRRTRGALTTARALTSARSRAAVTGALDTARLRNALTRFAAVPADRLLARTELPAGQALSTRGLPARTVGSLVRPLLAALLSDPGLTTSSRVADLTLRGFVRSGSCVPAGGMAAIPEALAAALPEGTVRTGVRAVAVTTNSVTTEDHGSLSCRAVVVATDAADAGVLLPGLRVPDFHPMTVLHHAVDEPLPLSPSLLVDGDAGRNGPLSHSWSASAVDPARAAPGRTLVTSVVLGRAAGGPAGVLDKASRRQLAALHGVSADRWELVAARHDARAVPAMPAPHDMRRPVRVLHGLYVCGEHRDTSTAQGALVSGRRAAKEVLRDFGLPLPQAEPRPASHAAA